MTLGQPRRVVVSHPTKQGNIYERPLAAQKAGLPVTFLTGFYGATMPAWLRFPGALSKRYRARLEALVAKRVQPELSASNIISVSSPLIEILKLRFGGLVHIQNAAHDRAAARWLRRDTVASSCRIFHGFQQSCEHSLRAARDLGLVAVMEVTSPSIALAEIESAKGITETFRQELLTENRRKRDQILREAALADRIIVQSAYSTALLVEGGVSEKRIAQVDLGVDTTAFQPDRPNDAASEAMRVLFVGQIGFRKGFDVLCEALQQVEPGTVTVTAAGHVYDEVGHACLKENPAIRYLGVVPDGQLHRLYQEADVLVIPSRSEGGCNVVMEALASGCPCAVAHGAISVIEHGRDGWVLPNGDAEALAALLRQLSADPVQLSAFRFTARQKALRHSWAQFHRRLGEFYCSLL
jgi:glycosyltransferase involved in cell wall biosynthesis